MRYERSVAAPSLSKSIGDFALCEYRLTLGDRSWSFLHTGAVLTVEQEAKYLDRESDRLPYGAMLWPASLALAHALLADANGLRGKRVLELGAGTGIPGIVASTLGAHVLQIDRSEIALHLCARNKERNRASSVEVRHADWDTFQSDVHYPAAMRPPIDTSTTPTSHDCSTSAELVAPCAKRHGAERRRDP